MMEASCFEFRPSALGALDCWSLQSKFLIGTFDALPWPTSVDAAMKIRGKLFYGRTPKAEADKLYAGCQFLFQTTLAAVLGPQKSSSQQAVRICRVAHSVRVRPVV
jgi:hypothetical protein